MNEIERLQPRGRDIRLYIYTGDKSNKITWRQIRAANGNYMAVDYVSATGKITRNWN